MSASDLSVALSHGGITLEFRTSDGYVNATRMCKDAGREWSGYARTAEAKNYQTSLARSLNICRDKLVQKIGNGTNDERKTWVHPDLALFLATKLSADFAVAAMQLVRRYTTGQVTTEESQAAGRRFAKQLGLDAAPLAIECGRARDKAENRNLQQLVKENGGGPAQHAMVNNAANQLALRFDETTAEYKKKHEIPKYMSLPEMMDGVGQHRHIVAQIGLQHHGTTARPEAPAPYSAEGLDEAKSKLDEAINTICGTNPGLIPLAEARKRRREAK
jgi:hypothetical protein